MERYLEHHLALTGIKTPIFDETAVTAIHQGSGGFLPKGKSLSQGSSGRRSFRQFLDRYT